MTLLNLVYSISVFVRAYTLDAPYPLILTHGLKQFILGHIQLIIFTTSLLFINRYDTTYSG